MDLLGRVLLFCALALSLSLSPSQGVFSSVLAQDITLEHGRGSCKPETQEINPQFPAAILVHPDAGAPAVAKGVASATWPVVAEQIRRRVSWDLDSAAELQVLELFQSPLRLGHIGDYIGIMEKKMEPAIGAVS